MRTHPSISVVLTTYNMETCVGQCIDSILNQSFSDFELLCIDDGSTDTTPGILRNYQKQDERIVLIPPEGKGVSAARNLGIARAQGEYLFILDGDDFFKQGFFAEMHQKAKANNSDIVVCRSNEFDQDTKEETLIEYGICDRFLPQKEVFNARDLKGCPFTAFMGWPWDKLYRTEFVKDMQLAFPPLENSEDLVFVFDALVKARRISIVDDVFVAHRVNRKRSLSNSREKHPRCFYEAIVLLKKQLAHDPVLYAELEWGFLNWALHHTVNNIETLPEGTARKELVVALFEGEFPELELDTHVPEYFALYDDIHYRYQSLECEYENKPLERSFWERLSAASQNVERIGLGATAKSFVSHRFKKG